MCCLNQLLPCSPPASSIFARLYHHPSLESSYRCSLRLHPHWTLPFGKSRYSEIALLERAGVGALADHPS